MPVHAKNVTSNLKLYQDKQVDDIMKRIVPSFHDAAVQDLQ